MDDQGVATNGSAARTTSQAGMALVGVDGRFAGKRFTLREGDNVIGRQDADVLAEDDAVSRQHCKIHVPAHESMVTDLGSTNGTWINDTQLLPNEPYPIAPGDVIKAGSVSLRLVRSTPSQAATEELASRAKAVGSEIGAKAKVAAGQVGADIGKGARFAQEKARDYAPVAQDAAKKALEHSRLATGTGIKPKTLIVVSLLLLAGCMVLPLALGWPLYISSQGVANNQSTSSGSSAYLAGAINENALEYSGYQYSALFQPLKLQESSVKWSTAAMAALAGPMLITGSPITMQGSQVDYMDAQQSNTMTGSALLTLGNATKVGWMFFLGLVLLLLIADIAIGDVYAMQKVIVALVGTWFLYCLTIGFGVQILARQMMGPVMDSSQMALSFGGLTAAPMKIAVIGAVYWVGSMFLRRLMNK